MPLTIVATFKAKPEAADRLRDVLQALAVSSREEAGCLAYRLYVAPDDPSAMVMVEQWADGDAIAEHNKSAHFQEFAKSTPELLAVPVTIDVLKSARES